MRFRIRQNGMVVAGTAGPPLPAEADIMFYADQYRSEGDLTIQYHTGTHWKRFAFMCQWPIEEVSK